MIFVDGCCNNHIGTASSVFGVLNGMKYDLIRLNKNTGILNDMILEDITVPIGDVTVIRPNFTAEVKQHNNEAELLAFIAGLIIALNTLTDTGELIFNKIGSDSDLMIKYWSLTGCKKDIKDPMKTFYINKSIELRRVFEEKGGVIIKIPGNDNPSDLGYHQR